MRLTFSTILLSALLAAPAMAAPYDGRWSIEVVTETGGCDRAYRYAILIENGTVRYGGRESFDVTGQVTNNGAVKGAIAHGQDRAEVVGRLDGANGTGTWTAKGTTRNCSGRWNAEKRG